MAVMDIYNKPHLKKQVNWEPTIKYQNYSNIQSG